MLLRTSDLFKQGNININKKFVKDGYIYLLRGDHIGLEHGMTSAYFKQGKTLASMGTDPSIMAKAQAINGNTAFLSATTNYYVAASFSHRERVYIIRIPLKDIYLSSADDFDLGEEEYMIPDYIKEEEIIKSIRYNKARVAYNFLVTDVGLSILPQDMGLSNNDLIRLDEAKLERLEYFNNSATCLDPLLQAFQDVLVKNGKK